jgi:hypothetical protein
MPGRGTPIAVKTSGMGCSRTLQREPATRQQSVLGSRYPARFSSLARVGAAATRTSTASTASFRMNAFGLFAMAAAMMFERGPPKRRSSKYAAQMAQDTRVVASRASPHSHQIPTPFAPRAAGDEDDGAECDDDLRSRHGDMSGHWPVTPEVAGSSPVDPAIFLEKSAGGVSPGRRLSEGSDNESERRCRIWPSPTLTSGV